MSLHFLRRVSPQLFCLDVVEVVIALWRLKEVV
jgi:hypothetical protein